MCAQKGFYNTKVSVLLVEIATISTSSLNFFTNSVPLGVVKYLVSEW